MNEIVTKEQLMTMLDDPMQTKQSVEELIRLTEEYPYFHTGYLLYLKGLHQTDEEKMTPQLKKAAWCVRDRDVLFRYIHQPVSESFQEKSVFSTDDLIDSFLKTNPRITPNDKQYEIDISESLKEDREIFTETLADIYVAQGHKDKAIEIYEHLNLKFPEKNIYFAAQIKRLKDNQI